MTWAEFKAAVEAAGVKDDDKINYIDAGVFEGFEPRAAYDDPHGWRIT